ncbi:hypothetical protein CDAR_297331 [Caerostris darwini]|uniref:Uncharacterized protein n=1 Tax=Caerostris darwini TaxID=1538125 RepID=A0AAV4PQN2_9ARAC|nr:hypothetical protein CDAR_297331 [Caerostris darwini]
MWRNREARRRNLLRRPLNRIHPSRKCVPTPRLMAQQKNPIRTIPIKIHLGTRSPREIISLHLRKDCIQLQSRLCPIKGERLSNNEKM